MLADATAGEQCPEVFDLDLVERANSLLDLFGELAVDAAGGELVKLGARVVPGERARGHTGIVTTLWENVVLSPNASGTTLLAAYLSSGFRDTSSARCNASRLRARPDVQARIREIQEGELDDRVTVQWVEGKLAPFLGIDATQMYEKDPDDPDKLRLKRLDKIPKNIRLAITRMKLDKETGRPLEIHLINKLDAGMALIRSLTPDALVQQNANITLDLATRLDAALGRLSPEDQRALADSLEALPTESGVTPELRPVEIGDRF